MPARQQLLQPQKLLPAMTLIPTPRSLMSKRNQLNKLSSFIQRHRLPSLRPALLRPRQLTQLTQHRSAKAHSSLLLPKTLPRALPVALP